MSLIFGYIPDAPDERDYRFGALEPMLAPAEDSETHVIDYARPTRFQGGNGSCAGCSVARGFEVIDPSLPDLSGRATWLLARQATGTWQSNVGTQIRIALAQARRVGLVALSLDPELAPHDQMLSTPALMFAADHKGGDFYRIDAGDLPAIERAIRAGTPVICGGDWDEAAQLARGDAVIDEPTGTILGGHAVCLTGARRVAGDLQVLIDNSHGDRWGNGGRAWATSAWLRTRRDLWAVTAAPR